MGSHLYKQDFADVNKWRIHLTISGKGVIMREKIHPKYFETTITCACGNVVNTRSTVESTRVEICSACHPFFTGSGDDKLLDIAGRVDKFKKRYLKTEGKTVRKKSIPKKTIKKKAVKTKKQ